MNLITASAVPYISCELHLVLFFYQSLVHGDIVVSIERLYLVKLLG